MKFQAFFSLSRVRTPRRFLVGICLLAMSVFAGGATSPMIDSSDAKAGVASPSAAESHLRVIDPIVQQAVRDGQIPGAVVVVGHDGRVVYRKAYGWRALEPKRESMTLDTVFDCASLTKVIATTTAVMQLVQEGKVKPND